VGYEIGRHPCPLVLEWRLLARHRSGSAMPWEQCITAGGDGDAIDRARLEKLFLSLA
jgi:hypothetical protein